MQSTMNNNSDLGSSYTEQKRNTYSNFFMTDNLPNSTKYDSKLISSYSTGPRCYIPKVYSGNREVIFFQAIKLQDSQ
jgi:hypothetical protein